MDCCDRERPSARRRANRVLLWVPDKTGICDSKCLFFALTLRTRRTSGTDWQSGGLLLPRATKRPQARESSPAMGAMKSACIASAVSLIFPDGEAIIDMLKGFYVRLGLVYDIPLYIVGRQQFVNQETVLTEQFFKLPV